MRPVSEPERLDFIDALRGLALFGILAANMRGFLAPIEVYFTPHAFFTGVAETWVQVLIDTFIQRKFVTIFAFLFGVGFSIQMDRAEGRFLSFYPRRLAVLAAFGLIHGIGVWAGDILLSYALAGAVFLFLFRKRSQRFLIRWPMGTVLVAVVGATGYYDATLLGFVKEPMKGPDMEKVARLIGVYSSGSPLDMLRSNWQGWLDELPGVAGGAVFALAVFAAGRWVWREGWLQNPGEHTEKFRRILRIGLPVGIVGNALVALEPVLFPFHPGPMTWHQWLAFILQLPVALALGASYVSALALRYQDPQWQRRLAPFRAVGRMALTNYVTQSIVCVAFFRITALYGKAGPAWALVPTVVIYAAQVLLSNWWMSRYRYGPLEWVWRRLTYGAAPMSV